MIKYSEEFKQKVYSLFGGKEELIKANTSTSNFFIELIESGDEEVGEYLKAESEEGVSAEEIVETLGNSVNGIIESTDVLPIYKKALRQLKAKEIYSEWTRLNVFSKLGIDDNDEVVERSKPAKK